MKVYIACWLTKRVQQVDLHEACPRGTFVKYVSHGTPARIIRPQLKTVLNQGLPLKGHALTFSSLNQLRNVYTWRRVNLGHVKMYPSGNG